MQSRRDTSAAMPFVKPEKPEEKQVITC